MILHQLKLGTSFDYVGADGFIGNDCDLARKVDLLGLTYMFDIHSDQAIYLTKPELVLPERKGKRGPTPKQLTATENSSMVSEYIKDLEQDDWEEIMVRKTAKGSLGGLYHFAKVFIWNKKVNMIEERLLVIRRIRTKSGEEVKYSFVNAELVQYTPKALAYMQAQRFFIEHCIKESKYTLGMDQFQTRKWMA